MFGRASPVAPDSLEQFQQSLLQREQALRERSAQLDTRAAKLDRRAAQLDDREVCVCGTDIDIRMLCCKHTDSLHNSSSLRARSPTLKPPLADESHN